MLCLYPHADGSSCGQCHNCLVNQNLAWRFRLKQEILNTDFAFWLTLQYDDQHLPIDKDNVPFVRKIDPQNYFRQIRKQIVKEDLPLTFKYFLTAEYCPTTSRPHYHTLLLFRTNQQFNDINEKLALRLKIYELLRKRWYHGMCFIKLFHSGVIKYLTDYVLKPSLNANYYKHPTFRLISKGIGEDYLYRLDPAKVLENGFKVDGFNYLPRYYRDKILPPETRRGLKGFQRGYYHDRRLLLIAAQQRFEESQFVDLHTKYRSVEDFIADQEFLRISQRTLQEQKQKRKLNF